MLAKVATESEDDIKVDLDDLSAREERREEAKSIVLVIAIKVEDEE